MGSSSSMAHSASPPARRAGPPRRTAAPDRRTRPAPATWGKLTGRYSGGLFGSEPPMEERTLAMSRSAPVHRRAAMVLALLSLVVVALGAAVSPAAAVPPSDPNADGAPNSMQAQLTTAAAAYVAAKAKLDASRGRQANLTEQLNAAQARLTALDGEVGGVAAAAYRGSRAQVTLVLLSTDSPNAFLHSAATVQYL